MSGRWATSAFAAPMLFLFGMSASAQAAMTQALTGRSSQRNTVPDLPIGSEEVRDALKVKQAERITIDAALAMPAHLGRAVCGRLNVDARGMPPRYVYVRYAKASPATRVFREPRGDPERKSMFYVIWEQLGCTGP